jgi:hypothetical protein
MMMAQHPLDSFGFGASLSVGTSPPTSNDPLLLPGPLAHTHLPTRHCTSALPSLLVILLPKTPVLVLPSLIPTDNISYNYLYKLSAWRKLCFLHKLPVQTISANWKNRWPPSQPTSTIHANNTLLPQPPTHQLAITPIGEGPLYMPPLNM